MRLDTSQRGFDFREFWQGIKTMFEIQLTL